MTDFQWIFFLVKLKRRDVVIKLLQVFHVHLLNSTQDLARITLQSRLTGKLVTYRFSVFAEAIVNGYTRRRPNDRKSKTSVLSLVMEYKWGTILFQRFRIQGKILERSNGQVSTPLLLHADKSEGVYGRSRYRAHQIENGKNPRGTRQSARK